MGMWLGRGRTCGRCSPPLNPPLALTVASCSMRSLLSLALCPATAFLCFLPDKWATKENVLVWHVILTESNLGFYSKQWTYGRTLWLSIDTHFRALKLWEGPHFVKFQFEARSRLGVPPRDIPSYFFFFWAVFWLKYSKVDDSIKIRAYVSIYR